MPDNIQVKNVRLELKGIEMMPFFWFYRYRNVDEKGWSLRIGNFFWLSKYGEEKYIKQNGGKKYSLTIMGKRMNF